MIRKIYLSKLKQIFWKANKGSHHFGYDKLNGSERLAKIYLNGPNKHIVTMLITCKKGLRFNGKNSTIRYRYGKFKVRFTSGFGTPNVVWMEREVFMR